MEISQEKVLTAWKRRCADLTEQVVILEALVEQFQEGAEPADD